MDQKPIFHRAKLDAAGVYQGVEKVDKLFSEDIPVPADCDLVPGKYIWVNDTFMPISVMRTVIDGGVK
jgi:hypothetical protein